MAVKKLENMERVRFRNSNCCGKRNFPGLHITMKRKKCSALTFFYLRNKNWWSLVLYIKHVKEFPVCLLEKVLY